MAMNFHLNGRLVKEPDFQSYGDNKTLARITIASDREVRSDKADFFEITVFGDTADQLRNGRPGDNIAISGESRQNVWEDNNGDTHYDIQFVGNQVAYTPRPRQINTAAAEAATTGARQVSARAAR
jgi:single-stranded DNA-binding protein